VPVERRARLRRSWRVYGLQLALGGTGLAASAAVLAAAVRTIHVRPAEAHRLAVAGVRLTYPAVNAAAAVLLGLAALGAAVLVVAVRAAWRQVRAHRRMVSALPVSRALPDHPSVLVVDAAAPLAFCAGWLRPRVYVSTGVLERLSDRELQAVLAHEQHHGTLRDPLRLAVGRILCQALFFLPVLRNLQETYAEAAELTADAAALEAVDGAHAPLASAMLAVGATQDGNVTGISPQRVDALLGRPVSSQFPRLLVIAALATIAMLVVLVWRASADATVQATLNLPIATSQPCILVLALVPVVACLAAAILRRPPLRSAA
jgi:Zn-dependent protease with chaperone function